ncbi:MAG: CDGSH iron-sulfur domain-containing protein [Proteobacteria bacterium]|nr:CDGSH iron-sulfur domain-containing protein [Pseudomonadota bacterium]
METVPGPQATIHFNGARCIHSRHCVLDRPDVFVPNVEGEWIHPERASGEEIAALAANCPSGAISCTRHDGKPDEAPPLVNTLRVRENGPLAVHARLSLPGGERALRATLCRCGASANKPFCDGSHAAAGFSATGEPKTKESKPLEVRNGTLSVEPQADGPLKLSGALELVSGTGRTINRVTEAYLCRCGASGNKPYCDGSHKRIGFKAG